MELPRPNRTFPLSLFAATIALSALFSASSAQQPTTPSAAAPPELQQALDESALPQTVPELLVELAKRANDVQETIASGAIDAVWVPAMATKTVALVLERHAAEFSGPRRAAAVTAIKQIVISSWDLDTYGDSGNRAKVDVSYKHLADGISALKNAYESR